mmetsp:Transcript_120609/g.346574  ORF Transcript_120609/g.346574 Transcript_120609/m.346574 type:complete len:260 (+) Transcript_120609:88-867(+)
MPQVFGLDIPDERMAKIARTLLQAHAVVVCLCVTYGILECVEYFLLKDAVEDAQTYNASAAEENSFATGGLAVVFNMFLPLICPIGVFFIIRTGLKTNNASLIQIVSFLDGCCSCCMGCGILIGVLTVIYVMNEKTMAEEYDCSKHEGDEDVTVARCEDLRRSVMDITNILTVLGILGTVVSGMLLVVCLVGTFKSREAHSALLQANTFCINLGAPQQYPNNQPGAVMVVGQVVGQPAAVPMGQPIGRPAFVPHKDELR